MSRTGVRVVFVTVAVAVCLAARSPSTESGSERHRSGITTPIPPTSTTAPTADGCPPGCRYPADHDAITVLASSATLVAVVTAHRPFEPRSVGGTAVTIEEVLQTNFHNLIYGGEAEALARLSPLLDSEFHPRDGRRFLVFISYDRGGSCLSALYALSDDTGIGTLVQSNDGVGNRILLPDRVVEVPPTIALSDVRARTYPTGGIVYPTDAVEWYCPGP